MTENNVQAAIDAALKIGKPFKLNDVDAVLVPQGMEVKTFPDLRKEEEKAPQLLKQHVVLEDIDSLIAYYNRFCDANSTIFANTESGNFLAVFDYHQSPSEPRNGTHCASYTCPKTPEWSAWFANSGKVMTQEEFGLFLEQNIEEIANPSGAQMLEIALTLKSKTNIDFSRAVRLDNGQTQFVYVEQMQSSAGVTGELQIPDEILLGLQPFRGSEYYETKAKFRYRIRDGALTMSYNLVRPHKIIDLAFSDVRKKLADNMKQGHLINGKPSN